MLDALQLPRDETASRGGNVADKPRKMEVEKQVVVTCPNCKKGIPCGVPPKKSNKDILLRIVSFQGHLRKMHARDSLSAIVGEVAVEIIQLRKTEESLRGYDSITKPKYLPPGYSPPRIVACPFCNKSLPCGAPGRKNRIDVLDRVKALQGRLKESKAREPLYCILEDALVEIRKLRSRVEVLKGRK
jgi:hypothetical protein